MITSGPDRAPAEAAGATPVTATWSRRAPATRRPDALARRFLLRPDAGAAITLAVLCVTLAVVTSGFLTTGNLDLVARSFSFIAIAALGQTLVILTGGIDLSVGAVMGLGAVSAAWLASHHESTVVVIAGGLAAGALAGLFNGLIIAKFSVPSFMVTLASLWIGRGLIIAITGGFPIAGFSHTVTFLGQGYVLGIPTPVWAMVVLVVAVTLVLTRTRFGWYVYALGGNEDATRLSGIRVDRVKIGVYVLAGVLAAFGGLLLAGRLGIVDATTAQGYELNVIAATVIGGVSLRGGVGSAIGAMYGAALLGVVLNGFVLLGVSEYWQEIATGGVIVIAVLVDRFRVGRSAT